MYVPPTSCVPSSSPPPYCFAQLSECSSTHDFDRVRQALLLPGVGNNDR